MSKFLFKAECYSSACTSSIFFIHPYASLYLGGILLKAIVTNVAVDPGIQISVGVSAFRTLGILPEAEWWDQEVFHVEVLGELLYCPW